MTQKFGSIRPQEGEDPEKIAAANKRNIEGLRERFTAEQEAALEEEIKRDPKLRERLRAMLKEADEQDHENTN